MTALVARPVRWSEHPDEVVAVLHALGLVTLADHGAWRVLAAGGGRVAVHGVPPGDPLAGTTSLGFELLGAAGEADLDAFAAALGRAGVDARRLAADHGPSLRVEVAGTPVLLDLPTPGPVEPVDAPAVLQLLFTSDVPGGADTLARLGTRPRVRADAGTWADLVVPGGGLVALHAAGDGPQDGPGAGELAFETSGLTELSDRLRRRGLDAALVDESFGHSLRVADPDGGALQVNGVQSDLYGYTDAG